MNEMQLYEMQFSKLKNKKVLLEKRKQLSDTDRKTTSLSGKSELKKNSLEIKLLRMEVKELELSLEKLKQEEKKFLKDALQPTNIRVDDRYSAMDMMKQFEHHLLELNNNYQSLSHRLKLSERNLSENQELLKEMNEQCRNDNVPTEADCIQNIRNLETENLKALKNISETEHQQRVIQVLQERLRKKGAMYRRIAMDLEAEKSNLTNSATENITEEQRQNDDSQLSEKIRLIKKLGSDLSALKDFVICSNIKNLDSVFLEQKATNEDLLELKKKSEKRLKELKEEKRVLACKRALTKEAENFYPERNVELSGAKSRFEKQEERLDSAKSELERLSYVYSTAKNIVCRLISKIKPKVVNSETPQKSLSDLSKQLENLIVRSFPNAQRSGAEKKVEKKGSERLTTV